MALRETVAHAFDTAITRCVRTSCRYPRAVITLFVALAIGAGSLATTSLGINTDTGDMISGDLPFRQNFAELKTSFPELDNNIIAVVEGDDPDVTRDGAAYLADALRQRPELFTNVYSPGIGPFFDRNALLYLTVDELSNLAMELREAGPLLSLLAERPDLSGMREVTRQLAMAADFGMLPSQGVDLMARLADVVEARGAGRPLSLDWRGLFGDGLVPDRTRWFVIAAPVLDFTRLDPAEEAMTEIRRLAADVEAELNNAVAVSFTGEVPLTEEEMLTVTEGAALAGLLSLILVTIILGFGVRSLRLVGACLSMLVIGLVLTAGVATITVGYLNLISVAFAVLFVGLGIDYAIHFALRYWEEKNFGHDQEAALIRTGRGVGLALALCTATTSLGFLAFTPTDFVGMAQLGFISSSGVVVAFICSVTLLPALLTIMPVRASRRVWAGQRITARSMRRGAIIARVLTVSVLVAAALSVTLIPHARFDGDPINLKDPKAPSVVAFKRLLEEGEVSPYAAEVLADSLGEAEDLATRLENLPEVNATVTVQSFIPADQNEKLAILDRMRTAVPERVNPAPRDLQLDEMTGAMTGMSSDMNEIMAGDLEEEVATNAQRLSVAIDAFMAAHGEDAAAYTNLQAGFFSRLPELVHHLHEAVHAEEITLETLDSSLTAQYVGEDGRYRIEVIPTENLDDKVEMRAFVEAIMAVAPQATGSPIEIVGAADTVARAMVQASILAAILISVMLFILLARIRDVALVLLPIVLAGILLVAATVVLGLPFNFANVIVLPLLIGLGVDSAVHLVMRAREQSLDRPVMLSSTPRAVTLSAFTTVGSFGTLAISNHRGTASMGELLMLAIALTLVCTLIVLPTVLDWVSRKERRPE